MTSRRKFIAGSTCAVVSALAACGGGGGGSSAAPPTTPPPTTPPPVTPPPETPPVTPPPVTPPPANAAPVWTPSFSGATLAIGDSLDLRAYVSDGNGDALTFSLNPASAPIAGVLTLTSAGLVTRIGSGDVAGVLIDADDGK